MAGTLGETRWQRLRSGPDGGVDSVRLPVPVVDDCPICGRFRGVGARVLERRA